ncbi:GNAT family N-acetyltransferase [Nonomuraea wenchangensis]|uniref:UDP-4-amino-4,6-dideoxy-N-acetyl-beta-L-altrosamine N-acetyltransferase n=1 Tax=Nonomuraea wenchangensis TaxID=568860 RepID=A0A1I0LEY6_9ACTN|nr:GNAT family N-acetyltransferase [Nonomuraea wenchangensis]SEU38127.1 UDP-4-amino-4,6-dideoxy-N-acetyl-beta-L-altrosamine N-acetyltransferase [Nonomuraea wenchangensis]
MLRGAHDDDLPAMRRWRNHPRVRAASFTTHEIGADEHARWWAAVRADATRRVLIYDHDGVPAGVVAYSDLSPASADWGFYLDLDGLERSGALLRAWAGLEREAIEHAFGPLGLTVLRGEVLADNAPVRSLHRRFGFAEVAAYRRVVDGVPRDVVAIELRREDA